jgi:hypothetical protein
LVGALTGSTVIADADEIFAWLWTWASLLDRSVINIPEFFGFVWITADACIFLRYPSLRDGGHIAVLASSQVPVFCLAKETR